MNLVLQTLLPVVCALTCNQPGLQSIITQQFFFYPLLMLLTSKKIISKLNPSCSFVFVCLHMTLHLLVFITMSGVSHISQPILIISRLCLLFLFCKTKNNTKGKWMGKYFVWSEKSSSIIFHSWLPFKDITLLQKCFHTYIYPSNMIYASYLFCSLSFFLLSTDFIQCFLQWNSSQCPTCHIICWPPHCTGTILTWNRISLHVCDNFLYPSSSSGLGEIKKTSSSNKCKFLSP